MVRTKKCTKCGEVKPLDEYRLDKTKPDGHMPRCKDCLSVNPSLRRLRLDMAGLGLHHCSDCKEWLPADGFHKNRATTTGLHRQCKRCSRRRVDEYDERKSDERREYRRRRHDANRDRLNAEHRVWYIKKQIVRPRQGQGVRGK